MKKVILISCLLFICIMSTSCSPVQQETSIFPLESVALLEPSKIIEDEILELINNHRLSKGLNVLLLNEQIRTQTKNHTEYMITEKCASHDNFFIRNSYLVANANAAKVSENVACGYTNPQSVVNAWLNSPTHRSNLEGDHTHFNITAEKDESDKWYFTNIFIKAENKSF